MESRATVGVSKQDLGRDFGVRIQQTIEKHQGINRPFFIVVIQFDNMQTFKKRRPDNVVTALFNELYAAVRRAVHPSQYVGIFRDGLGLVFDALDVGQLDNISKRLSSLVQHTLKQGHYNDLNSQWSEIIYQFLWPNKPGLLIPKVGWAIYPRDGATPTDLAKRALHHCGEDHSGSH